MIRRYEDDSSKSSPSKPWSPALIFFTAFSFSATLFAGAPRAEALPLAAPKAVSMNIRTVTENGVKWVRSSTEMCAVFPLPLDAYRTVLVDIASYPNYVPYLAAVELFTTPAGVSAVRQRFEVNILGFVFTSISAITIEPDDTRLPRHWRMNWNFIDSDGNVHALSGYWELEDVSEGGESRVLVRHVNDGLVRKKYPFQTSIMRAVAERELSSALLTAYHEAIRRWPQLSGSAKVHPMVENLPSYRNYEGGRD